MSSAGAWQSGAPGGAWQNGAPVGPPNDAAADGAGGVQNVAADGSTVGMQAGVINDSTVHIHSTLYQVNSEDPPEKQFEAGRLRLEGRLPREAEHHISNARFAGLDTPEVRYFWLLSMFSMRSVRDLSREERDRVLDVAESARHEREAGRYAEPLRTVGLLVRHALKGEGDAGSVVSSLSVLPEERRAEIEYHLENVLSGVAKEHVWRDIVERARAERYANGRVDRAWAYFHAVPARPRVAEVSTPADGTAGRATAILASLPAALTALLLVIGALGNLNLTAIVALVVVGFGGVIGVRDAFAWRALHSAAAVLDKRYETPEQKPSTWFTVNLRRNFDADFKKYRPEGITAEAWLAETHGMRQFLQQDLAYAYVDDPSVTNSSVRWMSRYFAKDAARRWAEGTFRARQVASFDGVAAARCVLALGVAAVALLVAVFSEADAATVLFFVISLFTTPAAVRGWYRGYAAQRIVDALRQDAANRLELLEVEYRRWSTMLESRRPSDLEMESWLRADTTILVDDALRKYRVLWRDVIARVVVTSPHGDYRRARITGGPWWYTHMTMQVYLMTDLGVRAFGVPSNFRQGTFGPATEDTFSYDALSSARLEPRPGGSRILVLTLNSGQSTVINIIPGLENSEQPSENEVYENVRLNTDASGIEYALHVLQGVAAEKRAWFVNTSH